MDELKKIDRFPQGIVTPPPSKSLSHRALLCAALANGLSHIDNLKLSEDVQATLNCISRLGVCHKLEANRLSVFGGAIRPQTDVVLDCGESGSTLRFLIPLALLHSVPIKLTGSERLLERPLEEYYRVLRDHGAAITQSGKYITVCGPLKSGSYTISGSISSQYITGLLFALPLVNGNSEIILSSALESKAYVDMTVDVMNKFGVHVENHNYEKFVIKGGQSYRSCDYEIETDCSAAAFFLASGALGCDVGVRGLNLNSLQGDKAFIEVLRECGIKIEQITDQTLKALPGKIKSVTVDAKDIPDLVPPLASVLCFCEGDSKIINAGRLRLKESDRLSALATEFNALGANFTEGEDVLYIHGVRTLKGGRANAHNDHRIAMAVAVASIKSEGTVELAGSSSVKKSYPDFWNDFCKIERSSQ